MDALTLEVDPVEGAIDGHTSFRVHGVPPGTEIHLDVTTVDAAGHHWASQGDYRVSDSGLLALSDPDKPWWNMRFVDLGTPPVIFTGVEGSLEYRVSASAGGASSSEIVSRSWGANLVREDLSGDGWRLRIYIPDGGVGPSPGVVVVPGTTGVDAVSPTAALLASHGYVTAVLSYMQDPGLPKNFEEIPLEGVAAAMAAFADHDSVDSDRIGVYAASVGTTVALSSLSRLPSIGVRAIIAVSPAHVVVQALGASGPPPQTSSVSIGGEPLPYMPIRAEKLIGQMIKSGLARALSRAPASTALSLRPAYVAGLRNRRAVSDALIPVDRIGAPILAVAGTDDASYPAAEMAHAMISARENTADRLLVFSHAGHFFKPPATPTTVNRNHRIVSGGTPSGIAVAQRTSWTAALDFLTAHL